MKFFPIAKDFVSFSTYLGMSHFSSPIELTDYKLSLEVLYKVEVILFSSSTI
jgi:hypothetical protein